MISDGPHIFASRTRWSKEIEILVAEVGSSLSGKRIVGYAEPLTLKRVSESDKVVPTTLISETAAQRLIDDLWDCGLRPSEGTGSAGQLAATQKHLADMRALVFKGPMP